MLLAVRAMLTYLYAPVTDVLMIKGVHAMLQGEAAMVPEDVGRKAAHMLLEEIHRGGVTDGTHQVCACPSELACCTYFIQACTEWQMQMSRFLLLHLEG